MSLISRLESLQIQFFNRFKIRRHEVPPPVLRKSRADLPYKKSELIVVAKSPVVIWPNPSHKFFLHTCFAWTALINIILYLHFSHMLETANPIYQPEPVPDGDEPVHEPNHHINPMSETYVVGFRNVCFICLIGVVTFFGLRPSRTIRQIIVHKPTKNVILGCNRFCGTVPNYYIFDGRESERIQKINDKRVHKVHVTDRKHMDIEAMYGEIKVPYGIKFNREAPTSITLPPELEVILKSSDLASVKSKVLIDILNELYKLKKEKNLHKTPLQDPLNRNNFTLIWNKLCAPLIFFGITWFLIWANADLFYKDDQKYVKEMRATKFGQGGIRYIKSLEPPPKKPTKTSTPDEFD